MMEPDALWLTESLATCMDLKPAMRVLDMGRGKGISSKFLAKEYGLQVWATDLWIDASDNLGRFRAAGVEDSVFPIHAEAHDLPFADGFIDAMVSVDAYHYFGTGDLYLENHMAQLIKPGGQIGIVVPGLVETSLGTKRAGDGRTFRPAPGRLEALDGVRIAMVGTAGQVQRGGPGGPWAQLNPGSRSVSAG